MPRPRGATAERFEDGLEDLIAAAGPPEVPKNWGNFPTTFTAESPPDTPDPSVPEPTPAPEPADSDVPAEEPEEAPEPTEEEPAGLAQLRRENEFLKLALQRPVQVQPAAEPPRAPTPADARAIITEALGGFRVTPEDMVTIGFPEDKAAKAAEYTNNLVMAASGAGAAVAIKQARYDYAIDQRQKQDQAALAELMWSRHPELQRYNRVVHMEATAVYQENLDPQGRLQINSHQLVDEAARRARATLDSYGVKIAKKPAARVLRPAFAEGGGGGRGAPKRPLNQFERELGQLLNARG